MKNVIAKASVVPALGLLTFAIAGGCGGGTETSPFSQDNNKQPPPASTTYDNPGQPPNNPPPDAGGGTDDAGPPPTTGNTGIGCGKTPARYIVLGHSVAHCFAVGGVDSEQCSLKATHTYMATKFPNIKYENYAVDGAFMTDVVNSQLGTVPAGQPGHVFVNLFIGGNDLAAHLYEDDATAKKSWDSLRPPFEQNLEKVFAFFEDTTKFPDGATILVNSQYNPFDECVAGIYSFVTLYKQSVIREFNTVLGTHIAGHPHDTAFVDQYTTFLGHGHNYSASQCPKYIKGAAYWMNDMIHPNSAGHVNLLAEMKSAVDQIYSCGK